MLTLQTLNKNFNVICITLAVQALLLGQHFKNCFYQADRCVALYTLITWNW